MDIKIGNICFVNEVENNEIDFNSFNNGSLNLKLKSFYLEDDKSTIFTLSNYELNNEENNNIIDVPTSTKNIINNFIEEKAKELFESGNYLRYDLYNNITASKLFITPYDKEFSLNYDFKINFENENVIFENDKDNSSNIIYNLKEKEIDNLEELYEKGAFSNELKNSLIDLEIQNGKAPAFVYEIKRITDFFVDKKSVNVLFENNDLNSFKTHTEIPPEPDFKKNEMYIYFDYDDMRNFQKENIQNIEYQIKTEDIQGFQYGKNEKLLLNKDVFFNLSEQISTSVEDKLLFARDRLKNEIQEKEVELACKYNKEVNYNFGKQMPYYLDTMLDMVEKYKQGIEVSPEWYSKNKEEIDLLCLKENAINSISLISTPQEIAEVADLLEDRELKDISKELENKNEESEENER